MLQTEQCDKFGVYQNPDTETVRWTIGTEINELKRQKHSDG